MATSVHVCLCVCNCGWRVRLKRRCMSVVLEDDSPLTAQLLTVLGEVKCGGDTGYEEVDEGISLLVGPIAKPVMLIRKEVCQ